MFRGVGGATHPDLAPTIPLVVFAMFQLKFAVITPALITGSPHGGGLSTDRFPPRWRLII